MEVLLSVVHIIIAIVLVGLVLVQDPKGGNLGGAFGGGGSNSVLGPMGAASLAQKLTRWVAVCFAATCIGLTLMIAKRSGGAGVTEKVIVSTPQQDPAAVVTTPQTPASTTETPAASQPTDGKTK